MIVIGDAIILGQAWFHAQERYVAQPFKCVYNILLQPFSISASESAIQQATKAQTLTLTHTIDSPFNPR